MNLEFGAPHRILFGPDEFRRLGAIAAGFGSRALIVKGAASLESGGWLDRITDILGAADIQAEVASTETEPTVNAIDELTRIARHFQPDVVIGIGGGSAMDAAKAVAAMLTNADAGTSVREFLEGFAVVRPIAAPPIPVIAVPTTAGTGSEATRNAVIRSDDYSFKRSMRSPLMRPEVALVDPTLSQSMPPDVTAATGADAETQLIESFVSARASTLTDGLAREGLRLSAWALEHAYLNPDDDEAREAMAMASLLSGITLDNAGLGAVHGLASPIGASFDIPHGVVCANLLPDITEANIRVAREEATRNESAAKALERYREIATIFEGSESEPGALVEFLKFQRQVLNIPGFAKFGIHEEDIPRIVAGCRGGSMRTNPVELDDATLSEILLRLVSD